MRRDAVEIILGFARTLRHAGVAATADRVQAMIAAVGHLDVLDPADVYWAGRLTLCGDASDLERYDAAFAAYFGNDRQPGVTPAPPPVRLRAITLDIDENAEVPDAESEHDAVTVQASRIDALRQRDVSGLDDEERDELRRLFTLLAPRPGGRRTRRFEPAHRGPIDLERTVRRMLAQGGEPSTLARHRRRVRPRRLVMLIDVSGSMEPYADTLLRFAHAAVRVAPARTEVFTLGTRLTRITRELRR
ncbi:MAG: VWA domain-containing protein, partial [Actinobacteria bacterium]|nr:VWA domain-containing protein [Actinomycetota bacterium]